MVDPERIFEHLQSEFFAALEACRVRPRPKAVHQLRTSARRMEALLHAVRRRRPGDAKLELKIDKALNALKPVRSGAGPVRDMDVQRRLLEELLEEAGGPTLGAETGALGAEARRVQGKLKKMRGVAADELVVVIANVADEARNRISLLQSDVYGTKFKSLLKDAFAIERRAGKGLDIADPESLHVYRKRAKFARYLAEMEADSATAERFAMRLKRVLDLIGGWHDWMLLTQLARETVGKSSTLAGVLKRERDGSLRRAVRSVERFDL